MILMTTVSCSRPDMPQPGAGIFEPEPLFSSPVTDAANTRLVQRDEGQPKVKREQPRNSGSRKVAAVHAPKTTGASVPRPASKKVNTLPRLDVKKEQQLFEEFLEWRRRQKDLP
jgi:hypothetical protein